MAASTGAARVVMVGEGEICTGGGWKRGSQFEVPGSWLAQGVKKDVKEEMFQSGVILAGSECWTPPPVGGPFGRKTFTVSGQRGPKWHKIIFAALGPFSVNSSGNIICGYGRCSSNLLLGGGSGTEVESLWCSKMANSDCVPGVTGRVKTLNFKKLARYLRT